jgi:hypothetical protein
LSCAIPEEMLDEVEYRSILIEAVADDEICLKIHGR